MPKIADVIKQHEKEKKHFYSFEYFPPRTEDGLKNLEKRLETMAAYKPQPPVFMDVTWGAGGSTSDTTVDLCTKIQKNWSTANMHITCTNMDKEKIVSGLASAKNAGIQNIVALRGDPPVGEEKWHAVEGGFTCALDLVKYVRKEYKDYFCISVAGYPEGHPDCESVEKDIAYLKQKVDAGGDIVITQLFYDVPTYIAWVKACRKAGIQVPILPGIMPIQSYGGFKKMTAFCKTKVPKEVEEALEEVKDDEEAVKAYGVKLGVQMCKQILESGVSPGLHFYTLNQEDSTAKILEELKFVKAGTAPKKKGKAAAAPAATNGVESHGELDEPKAKQQKTV
eukprot:gb/GEZN01011340.1/.p1 GENE.gb/GEZN01011340.1/~~gb/GEZN01011340.1/.p1  ORF type:complete len:338 (-),score=66.55 gb/GEZN01011340.1/:126-1139(-)